MTDCRVGFLHNIVNPWRERLRFLTSHWTTVSGKINEIRAESFLVSQPNNKCVV